MRVCRFGHEELADEIASYIHNELAIEISDDGDYEGGYDGYDGYDMAPPGNFRCGGL